MPLEKITIRDSKNLKDKSSGSKVLHVYDPHALIQAAGYLKFTLARDEFEGVFMRGQTDLHKGLIPGLFRGLANQGAQGDRVAVLNRVIEAFRAQCPILGKFSDQAHEPLLQHYGLRTTWIDLVDNVWVALWFSCHKAIISGKRGQFLHFERRIPKNAKRDFAYILLIGADIEPSENQLPGLNIGPKTELMDLRVGCPSIFLRPHSQHGLLFRKRGEEGGRALDYGDQIRGVIRISLADALSWLGEGKTLSAHTLFPPPFYDSGYEFLLAAEVESDSNTGSIHHVGT